MPDWAKQALATLAGLGVMGGILAFLIRHWLRTYIDHHYSVLLEREKAAIEVEKEGALDLLAKENAVYPQVVELLYRIRNHLRASIDAIKSQNWSVIPDTLQDLVAQYSETLYVFRAYIDLDPEQA